MSTESKNGDQYKERISDETWHAIQETARICRETKNIKTRKQAIDLIHEAQTIGDRSHLAEAHIYQTLSFKGIVSFCDEEPEKPDELDDLLDDYDDDDSSQLRLDNCLEMARWRIEHHVSLEDFLAIPYDNLRSLVIRRWGSDVRPWGSDVRPWVELAKERSNCELLHLLEDTHSSVPSGQWLRPLRP
jgi:hypothetical protein